MIYPGAQRFSGSQCPKTIKTLTQKAMMFCPIHPGNALPEMWGILSNICRQSLYSIFDLASIFYQIPKILGLGRINKPESGFVGLSWKFHSRENYNYLH